MDLSTGDSLLASLNSSLSEIDGGTM